MNIKPLLFITTLLVSGFSFGQDGFLGKLQTTWKLKADTSQLLIIEQDNWSFHTNGDEKNAKKYKCVAEIDKPFAGNRAEKVNFVTLYGEDTLEYWVPTCNTKMMNLTGANDEPTLVYYTAKFLRDKTIHQKDREDVVRTSVKLLDLLEAGEAKKFTSLYPPEKEYIEYVAKLDPRGEENADKKKLKKFYKSYYNDAIINMAEQLMEAAEAESFDWSKAKITKVRSKFPENASPKISNVIIILNQESSRLSRLEISTQMVEINEKWYLAPVLSKR